MKPTRQLLSVNVSLPRPVEYEDETVWTGIFKALRLAHEDGEDAARAAGVAVPSVGWRESFREWVG